MSDLTREDVAHLGRLARLTLTDDEIDHYTEQLVVILDAVGRISEVTDSDDVEPMSHPVPLENVFRADEVRPGLTTAEALAGAPAVEDDRFRVPRILDEE